MTKTPFLAAALMISPFAVAEVPHTFNAGTPAKSAEVNANFQHVVDANAATIEQVSELEAYVAQMKEEIGALNDQVFPDRRRLCHTGLPVGQQNTFGGLPFINASFTLVDSDGEVLPMLLQVPEQPMAARGQQADLMVTDFAGETADLYFCDYPARLDNVFRTDYDLSQPDGVVVTFYTETRLQVRNQDNQTPLFTNSVRFELGRALLPKDGSGHYQLTVADLPSVEQVTEAMQAGYQVYYHSTLKPVNP
ncbi:hypothetical protein KUV89_14715 [Marinobacter hydrocarbonoclasticus]|nr:hypothetical protein [Marinobacter nauticus]